MSRNPPVTAAVRDRSVVAVHGGADLGEGCVGYSPGPFIAFAQDAAQICAILRKFAAPGPNGSQVLVDRLCHSFLQCRGAGRADVIGNLVSTAPLAECGQQQ